jgi:hypothetical protein
MEAATWDVGDACRNILEAIIEPMGNAQIQSEWPPPAPGFDEVLLPGEPEACVRARRERQGVPIPEETWQAVCKTGAELGMNLEAIAKSKAQSCADPAHLIAAYFLTNFLHPHNKPLNASL